MLCGISSILFWCLISVSYSPGSFWIWSCEIVHRAQEEDTIHLRGFNWMDSNSYCILCTLQYLRRHSWWPAWLRWWLHSRPSSSWDWCHSPGLIITNSSVKMWCNFAFMKNNSMSFNHVLILPMMWLAGCKCHSNICHDVFIIFICCGVLFAQEIPHTLWYCILSIILIPLISEEIFIYLSCYWY